jgi:integrase
MTKHHSMTRLVREYIEHRRQLGFDLKSAGRILLTFGRYADRRRHRGPITADLALRWAGLPRNASAGYLANRLNIVRGLARFRAIFDPQTQIPPAHALGAKLRRTIPYIFAPAEIAALIHTARQLPPAGSLRPHTYATLFALLACTGMRHREVLRLTRFDIDWKQKLLHVRKTKFSKSRLVPLHPSTVEQLDQYARLRDRRYPLPRCDAFFVSMHGTALAQPTVHCTFAGIRDRLTWRGCSTRGQPRIHDLRHTFACHRLLQWYRQSVDVDHAIAALSTYLGHADVRHTYWYITAIPELLDIASSRFEQFASF